MYGREGQIGKEDVKENSIFFVKRSCNGSFTTCIRYYADSFILPSLQFLNICWVCVAPNWKTK